ncbi:apcomplexan conserved [Cryptosporidium sp. chipmunk genotype I]|uniref:apcomplexan conserved n=1 Tax=Cryptosporidium sp. chipmunk genotype I TaxID=1280935 RepID=UPI00351A796F|nr:apcomplexan conserved [Cryptosporidium sp. chipmunk genotype I]
MSNKEHEVKERFRPGDIFEGYYFPGVLCGRTLCYYRDVVTLLRGYRMKVRSMNKEINFKNPGTFKLFSQTYKEMKFSVVQFCTDIEEREECFQILLGVTIRLFNKRLELDLPDNHYLPWKIGQKKISEFQAIPENSQAQIAGNREEILDLNVSIMIMDSLQDTFEDRDNYNLKNIDLEELHHNVTIIYLLFLIFKSQYKTGLEDGQEESQTFEYMRVPVTIVTLETIKKVVQDCEIKGNLFPEVKLIVNHMLQDGILLINLYNGPQYYYQDRYGNPLMPDPLEKRFLEIEGVIDSAESPNRKFQQEDEKVFMDYLRDLRTQLVQKIEAKSLQIQKKEQNNEEAKVILETFQQLLNDFDERIAQYEFFKLNHSQKLNSIDLKVSKDIMQGKKDDNKRRKIDHNFETPFPRFSLPFTGDNKNEYGEWKELFSEKHPILEERIEEPKISQEETVKFGEKSKSQNDNPLDQNKTIMPNNYSETSNESQTLDNSLISILNRIEELVNREI